MGEISSRELAAVKTWADPLKRALDSRVKMREKLKPEQTLKLLLDGAI